MTVVGPVPDPLPESFGDIRDVLRQLPHPPDAGTQYALTDLFTVRHEIIRNLDPQPRSVFEFGALYGFFLVTALHAAPSIARVAWVDDQSHTPESNEMCADNVMAIRIASAWWWESTDEMHSFRTRLPSAAHTFDLVQVDGDHTYEGCLADLRTADRLGAQWIMVDDWDSISHASEVRAATNTFLEAQTEDWRVDEYTTVNGLAMLTRPPW